MSKIKCPIEWKPNANAMTMVASVVDKILLQDDIAEFIEKELIDAERGATRGGSSHPSSPRVPPPAAVPVAQIVGQAGDVVDVGLTDDEKKQASARAKQQQRQPHSSGSLPAAAAAEILGRGGVPPAAAAAAAVRI